MIIRLGVGFHWKGRLAGFPITREEESLPFFTQKRYYHPRKGSRQWSPKRWTILVFRYHLYQPGSAKFWSRVQMKFEYWTHRGPFSSHCSKTAWHSGPVYWYFLHFQSSFWAMAIKRAPVCPVFKFHLKWDQNLDAFWLIEGEGIN